MLNMIVYFTSEFGVFRLQTFFRILEEGGLKTTKMFEEEI